VPVELAFRDEVERLLGEDESLSQFVEAAVRVFARRQKDQAGFVAKGVRSLADAKMSGEYFDTAEVIGHLRRKLDVAKTLGESVSQ
jgi:hypothetical protein